MRKDLRSIIEKGRDSPTDIITTPNILSSFIRLNHTKSGINNIKRGRVVQNNRNNITLELVFVFFDKIYAAVPPISKTKIADNIASRELFSKPTPRSAFFQAFTKLERENFSGNLKGFEKISPLVLKAFKNSKKRGVKE